MFKTESGECAAFLVNRGATDVNILFQNVTYKLPLSSISILPDCKTVAFNTRMVRFKPTSTGKNFPAASSFYFLINFNHWNTFDQVSVQHNTRSMRAVQTFGSSEEWQEFKEMIPSFDETELRADELLEHMGTTKDSSDYLWYTLR